MDSSAAICVYNFLELLILKWNRVLKCIPNAIWCASNERNILQHTHTHAHAHVHIQKNEPFVMKRKQSVNHKKTQYHSQFAWQQRIHRSVGAELRFSDIQSLSKFFIAFILSAQSVAVGPFFSAKHLLIFLNELEKSKWTNVCITQTHTKWLEIKRFAICCCKSKWIIWRISWKLDNTFFVACVGHLAMEIATKHE